MWKRADGLSEYDVLKMQINLIRIIIYKAVDAEKHFNCFNYDVKHPVMQIKKILDETEDKMKRGEIR